MEGRASFDGMTGREGAEALGLMFRTVGAGGEKAAAAVAIWDDLGTSGDGRTGPLVGLAAAAMESVGGGGGFVGALGSVTTGGSFALGGGTTAAASF